MDFNLTKEQLLVRKMMADFTENEVKAYSCGDGRTAQFPAENIEKLFHYWSHGNGSSQEYGGAGADVFPAHRGRILSKQCASTGEIVATQNGLCCGPT